MKSVASQLQIGLSALLFACFLILFAFQDHLTQGLSDSLGWRELARKAEWVRSGLVIALQQGRQPDPLCRESPGSGEFCQWEWHAGDGVQRQFSPSLGDRMMRLPELPKGGRQELHLPEPGGGEMRVVALSTLLASGELIVAVGQAQGLQKAQRRKWRYYQLISGFLVFLIGAALASWYIRQLFEVFQRLNREVARQRAGEGGNQPLPDGPEEVQPLMQWIGQQRLAEERQLQKVRRTLSHVGHTLRIPITALFHLAEAREFEAIPEVRSILTGQTRLLEGLIERHLRRASLVGRTTTAERFQLGKELSALIRALDLLYYEKELELIIQVPEGLHGPGNREDFLELIGNLADNACKWARSRVMVSAGNEGGFWLTIEDDGPGVEESRLAELRQWSGRRLDESRPGQGMGLIIAQDIVAFYGGEITLGRSGELGGFRVSIRL